MDTVEFLPLLTRIGDLVLNPFIGSGSTAVACKKLGRHFIDCDINPECCDMARERIDDTPGETLSLRACVRSIDLLCYNHDNWHPATENGKKSRFAFVSELSHL
jgi:hypothetical protein